MTQRPLIILILLFGASGFAAKIPHSVSNVDSHYKRLALACIGSGTEIACSNELPFRVAAFTFPDSLEWEYPRSLNGFTIDTCRSFWKKVERFA